MNNKENLKLEVEKLKGKIEAYKDTQAALHDYINCQLDILEGKIEEAEEHRQDEDELKNEHP